MIYCGADKLTKRKLIRNSIKKNKCSKIYVVGDELEFDFGIPVDVVSFKDCIMYVHYYRFLSGIDGNSLFVMNNAMKSSNRYALNYNCIRKYAQQTPHRLIFQEFPIIEERKDFMILWDMIQPNPFLKEAYEDVRHFSKVKFFDVLPKIEVVQSEMNEEQMKKYFELKEKSIAAVKQNADIIPNRLLKYSEQINEKNLGIKFDTKKSLKKEMKICVNQSGVDQYFYEQIKNRIKEIEYVAEKI